MILELVEVVIDDVPSDKSGAGGAECLNRAEVPGAIDHDCIAGIDEAAGQQVESLLGAGKHQHIVRVAAEPARNRLAQNRLTFRDPVPPEEPSLTFEHFVERLPERIDRKAVDRRDARSERDDVGID